MIVPVPLFFFLAVPALLLLHHFLMGDFPRRGGGRFFARLGRRHPGFWLGKGWTRHGLIFCLRQTGASREDKTEADACKTGKSHVS